MRAKRGSVRLERRNLIVAGAVLALLAATGCASTSAYRSASRHMERLDYDRAVLGYSKALALDPGNTRYAVALERAKLKASAEHFEKGKRYHEASQLELAIAEYQQTLILAPGNQHASNELQRAVREMQRRDLGPSAIEQLKERARRQSMGPPQLDPRSNIPILLNFQEVEVGKIFEAISKASGINFIYDEKVELDRPRTIDLGNVTLEKALDILMLQTKNFFKVIDDYTLLIAPDTRAKRQEYEDQVIRTFFLSNADPKTVVTLLRSLLQSRQIAENEDLNSVTIKDTPEKVAIADRIINANDKSKGEVLIDVELLEINRTTAKNIGIDLSSKALSLVFRDGEQSLPLNNLDVLKQTGSWTVGVIPSVLLNFLRSDSDTKTIAKPQLRVAEGERAEILIGDRVPIPTTSFNTSQTVGGNIVPITSFTYQNVGITVQIEPRVHHNKEVTLQVQVEISQISGAVATSGGQSQPIIGTRQIQTVIRLRDGETNLLAGLIQTVENDAYSGLPGLANIPGVSKLTGNTTTSTQETDIIMTLTPRIIRIPDITEDDLVTLWVGTEENMRLRGPSRNGLASGPFGPSPATALGATPGSVSGAAPDSSAGSGRSPADSGSSGARNVRSSAPEDEDADTPPRPPVTTPVPEEDPDQGGDVGLGGDADEAPVDEDDPAGAAVDDDEQAAEPPAGPAIVRLVPSGTEFNVGDTVTIQVIIENAENVGSVPYHLRYDSNVLLFQNRAEGPFLSADGTTTVFLAAPLGEGGEIVVGHSRMGGGEGASGAGTLAVFEFVAINPGNCGFAFTGASVKDPQARNLPASFNTAVAVVQ